MKGNDLTCEDKTNIIISDDDPSVRLLLRHILENEGYSTLEAENGREALDLLNGNEVNMILLDAVMPEINGFEACKKIKLNNPDIPVIMITSLDDDTSVETAFKCGADDYITKPVNWSVLKHKILRAQKNTARHTIKAADKLTADLDEHQYAIQRRPRLSITDETTIATICSYHHPGIQQKKLLHSASHLSLKHARQLIQDSCLEYSKHNIEERLVLNIYPFNGNPLQYVNMLSEVFETYEIPLNKLDCVFNEVQLQNIDYKHLFYAICELPVNINIGKFSFSLNSLDIINTARCTAIELNMPLIHKTLGHDHEKIKAMLAVYKKYNLTLIAANISIPEELQTAKAINCTEIHGPTIGTGKLQLPI